MATGCPSFVRCLTRWGGTLATRVLTALLLITLSGHAFASPASPSQDSQFQAHSHRSQGLSHHRQLQQHNVHDVEHLAELEAENHAAHQLRLHRYTQSHSNASSMPHSESSHNQHQLTSSTSHSHAANSISHSHHNQQSLSKQQDMPAARNDDANRPESYFTAPTVEHILYPNSPKRTQNDTEWHSIHESFVDTLATGQKFDLILYGDSIFESLLGSVVGHPVARAAGNPAVWSQFHNNETDKIFALAGDSAFEMVWRLENGETPAPGQVKQVILLIGSNDLDVYWGELLEDRQEVVRKIVRDITKCIDILAGSCPGTEVFVMSLIHKGVRWEEPDTKHNLPNRYTPAIDAVNGELEKVAGSWANNQVTLVDCSFIFVSDWDKEGRPLRLNPDLMPDVLHPNAAGFTKLLTECIEPALHGI